MSLKDLFDGDGPVISMFSMLSDSFAAEVMATSGFDCMVVDMQHGFASYADLPHILRAYAITGTPVVVRVPGHSAEDLGKVLDWGANGVIVPLIETAEQAREAVAAVRYPPTGTRSFGPIRAALRQPGYNTEWADRETVLVAMIETPLGVENVEEIAAVPGLDSLLVGPADLSVSCGFPLLRPGTVPGKGSELESIIVRVAKACRANGLVAGIAGGAPESVSTWYPLGFRFITVLADFQALGAITKLRLEEARRFASASETTLPGA
jgi:4-hydroxy-2-oxoheptanedioate aldolase